MHTDIDNVTIAFLSYVVAFGSVIERQGDGSFTMLSGAAHRPYGVVRDGLVCVGSQTKTVREQLFEMITCHVGLLESSALSDLFTSNHLQRLIDDCFASNLVIRRRIAEHIVDECERSSVNDLARARLMRHVVEHGV